MPKLPNDDVRDIVYPTLCVNGVEIPRSKLKVTAEKMRKLLGWETEEAYAERQVKTHPATKPEDWSYGDHYLIKDAAGAKVRCHNNEDYKTSKDKSGKKVTVLAHTNRFLREPHMEKIVQDILTGHWRMNCETMIVSKTGKAISLQHRGCALVLAAERWHKQPELYPFWTEEPWIEALVVTGAEEDPETLRTLDNVLSRSLTDVFYTSELFSGLSPKQRQECSNMMSFAVGLCWKRTQAEDTAGGSKLRQTHSTSVDFEERHPKLFDAVKTIRDENEDRALSYLRLSAGECAGLLYLMAACDSDVDAYRSANPPREEACDLGMWDKAVKFWEELAQGEKEGKLVREALHRLVDPETGNSGRRWEKHAILVKAWNVFKEGHAMTAEDLSLSAHVTEDEHGNTILVDPPLLGGIDLGEKFSPPEPDGDEPSEAELEKRKAEEKKKRNEELKAAVERRNAEKNGNGKAAAKPKVDGLTEAGKQAQAKQLTKPTASSKTPAPKAPPAKKTAAPKKTPAASKK